MLVRLWRVQGSNMKYKDHLRNHVVLPGREKELEKFLRQDYEGKPHKWENRLSSNSEDALTWSCFDVLRNLEPRRKVGVLNEIWEDAYQAKVDFPFKRFKLCTPITQLFSNYLIIFFIGYYLRFKVF